MERENANLGTRKKSFEKARGNAEREEEMKERGHASREGPAGTRALLCLIGFFDPVLRIRIFVMENRTPDYRNRRIEV